MSKDLIRRSDAIKAVQRTDVGGIRLEDVCAVTDAVTDAINAIPTIEPKRGKWIPCSERFPNENEWVLCSCNNGFAILILKLKGKVWHKTESVEYLPKFVNAWMPLPEPWKGADNE